MKKIIPLLACLLIGSVYADERGDIRAQLEPTGFLYGFGLGINKEIYKGYNRRVIPLPILGYRDKELAIYGPFISYEFFQLDDIEFQVQAAPRFQGFDESDSEIFAGMQERKFSMDAGLSIKYERQDWKITLSAMFDVLNNSNGYEVSAQLSRAYKKGPVFIEPNISLSYLDDKHVNYYYGVSARETASFRPQYLTSSAVNSAIGIAVSTPLFWGGFTQLAIDYNLFDENITDSPLVEDKTNLSFRLLFSKFF
ncbi:MipA/OmpV family protein [Pseudoalteromonas sp.]|uniref:MipA/OmpV family protein n=1 Tax=Pseudoalteromonas sp. TaxID=53249 RepID=UPI003561EA28